MKQKETRELQTFLDLPRKQQIAISLLFLGHLKQSEIAQQIRIGESTLSGWKTQERFTKAQAEYDNYQLTGLRSKAVKTMNKLLDARSELVRYNTASYILDKTSAVKEDELAKAQARKVNAEADVVEYKAKLITNPEDVADRTVLVDDFSDDD
ncbi:hypothetical protein [Lentilactobacillus buchneri]|uniref:hypothetical protein n=1 Tax=Lentilactobacillus buchneri TaxID=1581 RepID=UPI0012917BAE|nr:hypothetical protein [Lentilactobacillus buchneri]MQM78853.1 hypothetical protein [Lentilactobacillus buchneri]MQM88844.1 hypothetical protein [Lentilactobacillus buchneri]MQN21056.1 hypothetical protein [Lentilactobacillus buchneri]